MNSSARTLSGITQAYMGRTVTLTVTSTSACMGMRLTGILSRISALSFLTRLHGLVFLLELAPDMWC